MRWSILGLALATLVFGCNRPITASSAAAAPDVAAARRASRLGDGHGPAGVARLATPKEGVLVVVRASRSDAGAGDALAAGKRVDVCLSPGAPPRRLKVFATYCGRGQDYCAAYVRVPADRALPALADYDFDQPPRVVAPGGSC